MYCYIRSDKSASDELPTHGNFPASRWLCDSHARQYGSRWCYSTALGVSSLAWPTLQALGQFSSLPVNFLFRLVKKFIFY